MGESMAGMNGNKFVHGERISKARREVGSEDKERMASGTSVIVNGKEAGS
jgi:hypothetical protein